MRSRTGACGFTLIELLVASAILSAALALVLGVAAGAHEAARARPEAGDTLQRVRVALSMIQRDLLAAGAGPLDGRGAEPLAAHVAPVLPRRTGARGADPDDSFATDRITILRVPPGRAAPALAAAIPSGTAPIMIDTTAPGCATGGTCGFAVGDRVVVTTPGLGTGHDVFSVQSTAAGLAHGAPDPAFATLHDTTSRAMPVEQHVYYLDRATRRLMLYDGSQSDVPLVDEIVSLEFRYWIDPSPTAVHAPPDGEGNCAYAPGPPATALLDDLGTGPPVPADAARFTDGPFCGLPPNRFDADLLRIRRVRVRIRAQAGDASLRGRGPLFANPGISTSSRGVVPDVEAVIDVTPRNLTGR